ncbi:hypothetical protein JCGZ_02639 [Jatropha curcas]|uniref:CID domain-containing protein n=1 Tax=Jatropha curcas TaxID=180498 RepID=A0A067L6A1_JATCU|nr:regulation of nuclear pre-mRNA domain-containing protein 2 [Jatropha curcas]XP_012070339.1 regulation of nuclear pre-mRNA domain-containing protein 2 [Jatropha curcas]KDP39619.1 hypothetical protein JCGZ_02639 [Jatropha curcas]
MSNDVFDVQILNEKLSKLNNSQQSIESLSRWCILHRKKARQIVETWDKLFDSSQREQRVSFLYLANDILQNSRRKGSEFVNEFWKVLPGSLKQVYENGDEHGKKVVTRLVDIWEERKVFGSRGQGLKDEMLGKNPPPLLASNGKSSNSIKIMKRDAHTVRIKLAVGGLPEKILTAFQSVTDEHLDEEAALNESTAALSQVGKIREEMENGSTQGNQQGSSFVEELQVQENVLQQCVGKLESAEATRAMLISQLKEALQDQESKLDVIRARLQAARVQIEQAVSLRNRLTSSIVPGPLTTITMPSADAAKVVEHSIAPVQPTSTPPQPQLTQPVVSFALMKTTDEDSKKAAAAAVAAKLAASTSSAQMLTSVLSSLVAEEAASLNGGLKSTGFTTGLTMFSPEKRPKLDKPMPADVNNADMGNSAYFTPLQQQSGTTMPLVPPSSSLQSMSQSNQIQTSFGALPPLPPPPPMSPANPATNQYVQSTGMMVGVLPYGYGANSLPPPPSLPPHIAMGLARPAAQQPQQSQPQQPQQQQQTPGTGGYYRPPGIGFYGQNHQPATPPVPRQ